MKLKSFTLALLFCALSLNPACALVDNNSFEIGEMPGAVKEKIEGTDNLKNVSANKNRAPSFVNSAQMNPDYEKNYKITRNYRIKFENAVKGELRAHKIKVKDEVGVKGEFSPMGKLERINVIASSGDKNLDKRIVNILSNLQSIGYPEDKSLMPDGFHFVLFPAPKYSSKSFVMVSETFKKDAISNLQTRDWALYFEGVEYAIKSGWRMPNVLNNKMAVVMFNVKQTGEIEDIVVVKSSNNKAYDKAAVEAVANSIFPPLPEGCANEYFQLRYIFRSSDFPRPKSPWL